jgi:hypothetical protein
VLLVRLDRDEQDNWTTDHSVRRFVRPVLMRDPQVEIEQAAAEAEHALARSIKKPGKKAAKSARNR